VAPDDKNSRRKTPENEATPGRPLTARAVAEMCGVELKTVHNWVAEGRLEHFRTPGRHLRFHPEAVHAFLRGLGYAATPPQRRVMVGASAAQSKRLRRVLTGYDCTWIGDPWLLLVAAGKHSPDALIIDSKLFHQTDMAAVLRALRRHLPTATIIVLGETRAPSSRGALRATWDDIESIRRGVDGGRG
jgi:excisionase family DNA binding protein